MTKMCNFDSHPLRERSNILYISEVGYLVVWVSGLHCMYTRVDMPSADQVLKIKSRLGRLLLADGTKNMSRRFLPVGDGIPTSNLRISPIPWLARLPVLNQGAYDGLAVDPARPVPMKHCLLPWSIWGDGISG